MSRRKKKTLDKSFKYFAFLMKSIVSDKGIDFVKIFTFPHTKEFLLVEFGPFGNKSSHSSR